MEHAQPHRQASEIGHLQGFVKQFVYGGNDGIVTTFAIVASFAGASAEGVAQIGSVAVLVFGLANLLSDGVSMGLGEFLSGQAQHDLYRRRRRQEFSAVAGDPQGSLGRLEAILTEQGLSPEEARRSAEILSPHPSFTADLIMTYEGGIRAPESDRPALNGLVTFAAFLCFGCVPLAPYFLFEPSPGLFRISVLATLGAMAALGLTRWLATGARLGRTLMETMGVGIICALVAYGVGFVVGG